ncbi:hypothetical protein A3I18_01815 [Candidatus Campbellbacteria bacterium RIFCSPLOWO2_02_FULL_35_11]|uniref:Uncharacterized protein n=1 Tax=Candidatus Campbellbacteria bacterium RIFCSPLOWO2_02_FULL_35_11 TaxID=1797581 RepID=A0A1F5ERE3_9BACT|nr:MAG: hypothetical protein A3I18_01815 [Candidatus Campbellbacteria bacterium RIFCSPLOWO2_02_FULL_35_11]
MKIVSYLHPVHGFFAQYCRRSAGWYPGVSRRARRAAEIAAHRDGVRQSTRAEQMKAESLPPEERNALYAEWAS